MCSLTVEPITLLSFMQFTEAQLDKLQAVSPRLEVRQMTDARFEDIPEDLRNRVEIEYGWGDHFDQAHRLPKLK